VQVADFVEEVDLVLAREQRSADTVHGRVAPTLLKENVILASTKLPVPLPHLIVEPALFVQKLYKLRVGLTSPEIEVTDLKVTPD